MADETLELTIQVFNDGKRRYAKVTADTPSGRYYVNNWWLSARSQSAYEAAANVLHNIRSGAIRTRPGRKPKDYWKVQFLCFPPNQDRRPVVPLRPVSRTSAGIPIAPTKKEMVEQVGSIVGNPFVDRGTAIAALEDVLDTLRSDKGVDRMNGFPVQGSVPS